MVQYYIFAKGKGAKRFTLVARAFSKKNANEKAKEHRKKGSQVKIIDISKAEKARIGKLPRQWRGTTPLSKTTLFRRVHTEKELGRRL